VASGPPRSIPSGWTYGSLGVRTFALTSRASPVEAGGSGAADVRSNRQQEGGLEREGTRSMAGGEGRPTMVMSRFARVECGSVIANVAGLLSPEMALIAWAGVAKTLDQVDVVVDACRRDTGFREKLVVTLPSCAGASSADYHDLKQEVGLGPV